MGRTPKNVSRPRPTAQDLDDLIGEITVDTYNDNEALTGFEVAFDDGRRYDLALLDVDCFGDLEFDRILAAYRQWLGAWPAAGHASGGAEHVVVMHRLLVERPEVRAEARRIAASLLAQTKRFEVARESRQPGGGYVEASEVSWELLSVAVDVFVDV